MRISRLTHFPSARFLSIRSEGFSKGHGSEPPAYKSRVASPGGNMKKIVSLVVLLLAAQALHADDTFSWTYGGGTDPVHAYGTLEATRGCPARS